MAGGALGGGRPGLLTLLLAELSCFHVYLWHKDISTYQWIVSQVHPMPSA